MEKDLIIEIIDEIRTSLVETFDSLDTWFEKDIELRSYVPSYGGWMINQILEHVYLTNHFLLILINKGVRKSVQKKVTSDLAQEIRFANFNKARLTEVGIHKSFQWIRPEHMEPTGEKTLDEIRELFRIQLQECLSGLDQLPNGEGVLTLTTMTVNNLGKLNVYEYMYFLAMHGQRHIDQMTKIEKEFATNQ